MYKININDNTLYLIQTDKLKKEKFSKNALISPYSGKTKNLLSFIDMLENTNRFDEIAIHFHDVKVLKSDFEGLFKVVRASGGVVLNPKGKILMIFRKGHWDLPKGKIDIGEKKKDAASREVQEETGVEELIVDEKVITTRHVYRLKNGKRAIKKTYWYKMKALAQPLVPQIEEDIEKAEWMNVKTFVTPYIKIYPSILDVLKAAKYI